MSGTDLDVADPRVEHALAEFRGLIQDRYPSAMFVVFRGEDPEGIYLTATVDVDDADDVVDVILDRLLEVQVDEGLPVYVIPIETPERVAARVRAANQARPLAAVARASQG